MRYSSEPHSLDSNFLFLGAQARFGCIILYPTNSEKLEDACMLMNAGLLFKLWDSLPTPGNRKLHLRVEFREEYSLPSQERDL